MQPDDKKPFEARAAEDKVRYAKEKEAYESRKADAVLALLPKEQDATSQ